VKVTILEGAPIDMTDFVKRSEYATAHMIDGHRTLAFCLSMSSHYWIGMADDAIACTWGLIPPTLLSDQAYLWMVVTSLVREHPFIFVRHSQREVEKMLKHYSTIVGHCECHNEEARRWVKWLGAKFGEPQGTRVPFVIRRKHG